MKVKLTAGLITNQDLTPILTGVNFLFPIYVALRREIVQNILSKKVTQ